MPVIVLCLLTSNKNHLFCLLVSNKSIIFATLTKCQTLCEQDTISPKRNIPLAGEGERDGV